MPPVRRWRLSRCGLLARVDSTMERMVWFVEVDELNATVRKTSIGGAVSWI